MTYIRLTNFRFLSLFGHYKAFTKIFPQPVCLGGMGDCFEVVLIS